jgi:hypothetical protein
MVHKLWMADQAFVLQDAYLNLQSILVVSQDPLYLHVGEEGAAHGVSPLELTHGSNASTSRGQSNLSVDIQRL